MALDYTLPSMDLCKIDPLCQLKLSKNASELPCKFESDKDISVLRVLTLVPVQDMLETETGYACYRISMGLNKLHPNPALHLTRWTLCHLDGKRSQQLYRSGALVMFCR